MVTLKDDFSPVVDTAGSVEEALSSFQTIDIGTPVYAAPEIASGKTYSSKVDMYSLGICFFEMCYRMTTGMQRAAVLKELRASVTFPSGKLNVLNLSRFRLGYLRKTIQDHKMATRS